MDEEESGFIDTAFYDPRCVSMGMNIISFKKNDLLARVEKLNDKNLKIETEEPVNYILQRLFSHVFEVR